MDTSDLTENEIKRELNQLYCNRKKFNKVAGIVSKEYWKYTLDGYTPSDIIQEAALRILKGKRKIKRNYEFCNILIYVSISVMRDMSRRNYNKCKKLTKVEFEDREAEDEVTEDTIPNKIYSTGTDGLSLEPEQQKFLEKEEERNYIYKTSGSDTNALKVFELRSEGYSNKEIAERCNIKITEVENALNRLRTRGKKLRRHT